MAPTLNLLLVKPPPRLRTIRELREIMLLEPLELGYLAAGAGDRPVRVLDLRLTDDPQAASNEAVANSPPDVIGLTGYSHEVRAIKELAREFKAVLPNAIVVVGGHHATVRPETFDIPQVDFIVRGEGSLPFAQILDRIEAGRPCVGIPNVLCTGAAYDAAAARLVPEFPELEQIPSPRRDLWDYRNYTCLWPSEEHPPNATIFPPAAIVRSSYGCQMNCSFCVIPTLCGRRRRIRNPESLADELAALRADHVYFCDDETFIDADYIMAVADAIERRGVRKRYFAWARSTTVRRHPEVFSRWREIGLDMVFLGYESISNKILKDWKKGATLAEHDEAHRLLRRIGIAVNAGFMLLPEFTAEQFDALADYMRAMPPAQFNITVCTPSPGSADWNRDRDRFICDPYDLHDCMHPLVPTTLPLREFYDRYAQLIAIAAEKNPIRRAGIQLRLLDIGRAARATRRYVNAVRDAWRDYEI